MKELRDDRVHARMALVRELFGLPSEDVPPEVGEVAEPLAEVRAISEHRR
jgi:hypothetical protein